MIRRACKRRSDVLKRPSQIPTKVKPWRCDPDQKLSLRLRVSEKMARPVASCMPYVLLISALSHLKNGLVSFSSFIVVGTVGMPLLRASAT